jgi:hypothetical protein
VVSGGGKCRKETDTEATADAQLIEAGYPRWKLVIAGYTTQQMMDAGLTYTQVVDAKEDSYLNEDNQNPFAGPRVNGGLASPVSGNTVLMKILVCTPSNHRPSSSATRSVRL